MAQNIQGASLSVYSVGDVINVRAQVTAISGDNVSMTVETPLPTDLANVTLTASLKDMRPSINPCNPVAVGQLLLVEGTVTSISGSGAGATVGLTIVSGGSTITIAGSQAKTGSNFLNEL